MNVNEVKYRGLLDLQDDWDSYGAVKPSCTAITNATEFVIELGSKFNEVSIYPLRDGGVQVEIASGIRNVEIEFHPDGTAKYLRWDSTVKNGTEGSLPLIDACDAQSVRLFVMSVLDVMFSAIPKA